VITATFTHNFLNFAQNTYLGFCAGNGSHIILQVTGRGKVLDCYCVKLVIERLGVCLQSFQCYTMTLGKLLTFTCASVIEHNRAVKSCETCGNFHILSLILGTSSQLVTYRGGIGWV